MLDDLIRDGRSRRDGVAGVARWRKKKPAAAPSDASSPRRSPRAFRRRLRLIFRLFVVARRRALRLPARSLTTRLTNTLLRILPEVRLLLHGRLRLLLARLRLRERGRSFARFPALLRRLRLASPLALLQLRQALRAYERREVSRKGLQRAAAAVMKAGIHFKCGATLQQTCCKFKLKTCKSG